MSNIVYAVFTAWATQTVKVNKGEVWDANDPVVRKHPSWFTNDPAQFIRRSGTHVVTQANAEDMHLVSGAEQATAAPGEKRVIHRG